MKFVVIGDVHSRAEALEKALKAAEGYKVVFIGDILDGRHKATEKEKTAEDQKTLELVNNALATGATLILGNHEQGLINTWSRSSLTMATKTRLMAFSNYHAFLKAVKKAESYIELTSGDKTYNIAHALPFKSATKFEQSHGPKENGQRVKWFLNSRTWADNIVKVCGHYHQIIIEPNLVVLDGDYRHGNCIPMLVVEDGQHTLLTFTNE
jgi:UDP-2,3-diacylglucosamine pyrophosphatase LpxH